METVVITVLSNICFHKLSVQSPHVSFYFSNKEGGGKTDKSEEERLQRAKLQAEAAER